MIIMMAFVQVCLFIIFLTAVFFNSIVYERLEVIIEGFLRLPLVVNLFISLIFFYFILLFLLCIYYRLLLFTIREKEGVFSMGSSEVCKQEARIFLDYIIVNLALPLILFFPVFLKLLGAKIGKDTRIPGKVYNADIVELGDNVVVGVGATIFGHIGQKGLRIFKRVKIGNNCTIGINSVIFPGVEIGDNSVVAAGAVIVAGAVVPKNTRILPNEVWGGLPVNKDKGY